MSSTRHERILKYGISRINGGLTKEEIYSMYDEALKVLEEVGIECHGEKVLARLADFKGIKIGKGRVYFNRDLIDGMVKELQNRRDEENKVEKPKRTSFGLGGPYTCFNYLDFGSDRPRKATLADLRTALKLMEGMNVGSGTEPIIPGDIPIKMQRITMLKTAAESSESIGGCEMGVASIEEAELICEMGEASGRKPPYVALQYGISPLKFNDEMLEIGCHFLDKGKDRLISLGGSPMVCAGTTGPVFMPGPFVLSLAEYMASEVLSAFLFREHHEEKFYPGCSVNTFDMKYGNYILGGSPEHLLLRLASAQIGRELFRETYGGGLMTTCSSVDEQAAAERALNAVITALDGATGFGGGGMIALDMIFSPEQLVIDREIVDWVQRFMAGMELVDKKGMSFDVIKEVGPGGNYMTHETTLDNYKKFYWQPKLFEHFSYGQWLDKGCPSLRSRAEKIAKEKIDSYNFEIDASKRNDMEAVYKKAQKILV